MNYNSIYFSNLKEKHIKNFILQTEFIHIYIFAEQAIQYKKLCICRIFYIKCYRN